jgi:hypothetical protein
LGCSSIWEMMRPCGRQRKPWKPGSLSQNNVVQLQHLQQCELKLSEIWCPHIKLMVACSVARTDTATAATTAICLERNNMRGLTTPERHTEGAGTTSRETYIHLPRLSLDPELMLPLFLFSFLFLFHSFQILLSFRFF